MTKVLLIICDGLSDRPIFELGNKTPLEAANTPNLDKLAENGMCGLMHTIEIGVRPGSDVAHLSILGYAPKKYYNGRGPFEAAGYGIKLERGDVAFRGNFSTVDDDMNIIDRRAGRISDTAELIRSLKNIKIENIKIELVKGVGHRVAVVFRGKNISSKITDSDPHTINKKVLQVLPLTKSESAIKTARIVNLFLKKSYEILNKHKFNEKRKLKANMILLRGAGQVKDLPTFKEKYGFKAACIAGAGLYKGIAMMIGMDILQIPQATGTVETNLNSKIRAALNSFDKYDFIFLHIKGTDILAEDGNFNGKKDFIEKIDKALKSLIDRKDILKVITADHTTSSILKIHTADPVPVLISGENIHTDHINKFGERAVLGGRLGHIKGENLMPIIIDCLGRAPLYGA
jgi:2,3-bisphosphoglycerate-independent phosphoglycerate mutase